MSSGYKFKCLKLLYYCKFDEKPMFLQIFFINMDNIKNQKVKSKKKANSIFIILTRLPSINYYMIK